MIPRLAEIWIHPVKSLAGHRVDVAAIDDRGLTDDRRFMLVDASGRFLTQREHPRMARLAARLEGGALTIAAPDGPPFSIPRDADGPPIDVTVWDDRVRAVDLGTEAAAWLSEALEREARLVRMPPEAVRPADPRYARPDDLVSFADGFPFLLLGRASVDDLNARLDAPVELRRFRPNLVVEGADAYAEDGWAALRIGDVTFHATVGCARCAIVDVDPARGVSDKGVLPTLARYRKRDGKVWLGVNLVHDGPGTVRVGDSVTLA